MKQITKQNEKREVSIWGFAGVCAVSTGLLVLSLFFKQILLLDFLFLLAVLVFSSSQFSVAVLFFQLPFAILLRYDAGMMSFFTPLCMAEVFLIFFRRQTADGILLAQLLLLGGYILFACGGNYVETVKFSSGLALFALLPCVQTERGGRLSGYAFGAGVLLSSIIALFQDQIPRLMSMYVEIDYVYLSVGKIRRFSGTFQDPNYFAVAVILAITFLECEKQRVSAWAKKWLTAAQCGLLVFGALTYSKSFFLMFLFMCVFFAMRHRSAKKMLVLLALVCLFGVFYVVNPFGIAENMTERLVGEDLTTGRTTIWGTYARTLLESLPQLLFGNGIGTSLQRAAHNTWLQTLYEIGLTGFVLFVAIVIRVFTIHCKPIRRNVLNYSGLLVLVVMFSFLNGLRSYELPFYLALVNTIYNTSLSNTNKGDYAGVIQAIH